MSYGDQASIVVERGRSHGPRFRNAGPIYLLDRDLALVASQELRRRLEIATEVVWTLVVVCAGRDVSIGLFDQAAESLAFVDAFTLALAGIKACLRIAPTRDGGGPGFLAELRFSITRCAGVFHSCDRNFVSPAGR